MRAQFLSQMYVQALKFTVQRERPDQSNDLSFPSGHSASAFATASVLQRHYGWKVGVPATVVAAYVATARVKDNKHDLSDVIFGSALGIAAERTVTLHAGRYGLIVSPSGRAEASLREVGSENRPGSRRWVSISPLRTGQSCATRWKTWTPRAPPRVPPA